MKRISALLLTLSLAAPAALPLQITRADVTAQQQIAAPLQPAWMKDTMKKLESELIAKYGEGQRTRVQRGLKQVADFWRAEDGDAATMEDFVRSYFAGDQQTLDTYFQRIEAMLEKLDGYMHEINREFRNQSDLDVGPITPV